MRAFGATLDDENPIQINEAARVGAAVVNTRYQLPKLNRGSHLTLKNLVHTHTGLMV